MVNSGVYVCFVEDYLRIIPVKLRFMTHQRRRVIFPGASANSLCAASETSSAVGVYDKFPRYSNAWY